MVWDVAVAREVIAAAVGAGAHRNHKARFLHLDEIFPHGRPHLVAQCIGRNAKVPNDRAIGAVLRRGANMLHIVARPYRRHHLNGTARESERVPGVFRMSVFHIDKPMRCYCAIRSTDVTIAPRRGSELVVIIRTPTLTLLLSHCSRSSASTFQRGTSCAALRWLKALTNMW